MPFALWIAGFSYAYVYRVELCKQEVLHEDGEKKAHRLRNKGKTLGRTQEIAAVRAMLNNPAQIIVVAGPNEVGKSRFLAEVIGEHEQVTSVMLGQSGDLSSLTQVFADAFGLKWLQMRHMLVDVLPFAGSEVFVMKERFSDRDFEQSLRVITDSLKMIAAQSKPGAPKPVIVIDDLGEGDSQWIQSKEGDLCLQRFMQWCVYVTKERRLAHIIFTGNEQLVFSLTQRSRATRGNIKFVGLGPLNWSEAADLVRGELPGATPDELRKLIGAFGGWAHDLTRVCRDVKMLAHEKDRAAVLEEVIKSRKQAQIDRVATAFAKGTDKVDGASGEEEEASEGEEEEMDNFMDPLKHRYSEQAFQKARAGAKGMAAAKEDVSWTPVQLWQALQKVCASSAMSVPFGELRDCVFGGDARPLLDLMKEDVLGFEMSTGGEEGKAWCVVPATPALGKAFQQLVAHGELSQRFGELEHLAALNKSVESHEQERRRLLRERHARETRKASLASTVELGQQLGHERTVRQRLGPAYQALIEEEAFQEERERDLRTIVEALRAQLLIARRHKRGAGVEASGGAVSGRTAIREQLRAAVLQIAGEDASPNSLEALVESGRLEHAFLELDASHHGALTAAELATALTRATGGGVSAAELEALAALVKDWDADRSGLLDYREFVRMLTGTAAAKE